jgi:uncharacterized protein YjlB
MARYATRTPVHRAASARCEPFMLAPNGWVPNNARLAVLLWRGALADGEGDCAARFEALFAEHGWPPQWRDGVFDYHHYHSTAHEALGFASGEAQLIVGGPEGRVVDVRAGDVLLLPAGTGHCLSTSGPRLQVVGAYPPGQQWDIRRDALTEDARIAMLALPFPARDPVGGEYGSSAGRWR